MLISDIHNETLLLLNSDTSDYDSSKLMVYTNPAIQYVQDLRIQSNDPEVITEMTIVGAIAKPIDFYGFIPQKSSYPLNANGNNITPAIGAPPSIKFKYSQKVTMVSSVTDTFPLPDEYARFVEQYISIRLQSDNSMNVTQDMNILTNDINAFIKAKGG